MTLFRQKKKNELFAIQLSLLRGHHCKNYLKVGYVGYVYESVNHNLLT